MAHYIAEISSINELESTISKLKRRLRKGERVKLILNDVNLINHVARLSMKYGLSLISAEETHGNRIIIEFENRFK
ncbi:MAG: hypothetical protein DRO15_02225 [Thermoprotei archaeon]|nr:MAG: hypothetical protein DRO15_02225 [Thermoprotei archaeon]